MGLSLFSGWGAFADLSGELMVGCGSVSVVGMIWLMFNSKNHATAGEMVIEIMDAEDQIMKAVPHQKARHLWKCPHNDCGGRKFDQMGEKIFCRKCKKSPTNIPAWTKARKRKDKLVKKLSASAERLLKEERRAKLARKQEQRGVNGWVHILTN